MKEIRVNRQYKDRLFRLVFKEKDALLELYNALNGSAYTDAEELTITTLENALYMTMKNDSSFIVDDVMNLYEHQSSYNPNMPLRGFFYFAELYRNYVDEKGLDLYGSARAKLPLPQYLVFYNGKQEEPDRMELKLSDSFIRRKEHWEDSGKCKEEAEETEENLVPCLEVRATMVNINPGHNEELMKRCGKLWEYACFISAVRDAKKSGATLEEAAKQALERCIEEGILKETLCRYRTEVIDMILEEYDEQRHIENERNISREEGLKAGRQEGGALKLISQVKKKQAKGMSAKAIADAVEEEKEYVERILSVLAEHPEMTEAEILEEFMDFRK